MPPTQRRTWKKTEWPGGPDRVRNESEKRT